MIFEFQGLSGIQNKYLGLLNVGYSNAIATPVSYTNKAGFTKTYQADRDSVRNMQDAILGFQAMGGIVPSGFYWVAADNTQVPFTFADVQGLAAAAIGQGWAQFQKLQTLKAQIRAATTPAAAQSISW